MNILVTNDDGIESEGIWELALALREAGLGTVTIVAPLEEHSGAAMSFLYRPAYEATSAAPPDPRFGGIDAYALASTPVGCVSAGVLGALGPRPDLVVSGVNRGLNTGVSVMLSGTVGAAMAAACWGLPAMAVSLRVHGGEEPEWRAAAEAAARLVPALVAEARREGPLVLNVNVPHLAGSPPRGYRQTQLSTFFYGEALVLEGAERTERGHSLRYALDPARLPREVDEATDDGAVRARYVSVTPLRPLTSHERPGLDEALGGLLPGGGADG
ncbi:MAG TPA: 5'/3'-nucleotidase SurE [Polyangiaceae bacterium]|nr:5'/3'-nucleotidase SurE [Polyangiaceae bacterium]